MITIFFNDQLHAMEPGQSLHDFLIQQNYVEAHFAVAINDQLLPRSLYRTTMLKAHDRIDIFVPMQGG